MKRRMAKKMEMYKILPHRLINKYIYYTFRICSYWSLDTGPKVYIMARDGRVMIYSYYDRKTGNWLRGDGYAYWHDDDDDDF